MTIGLSAVYTVCQFKWCDNRDIALILQAVMISTSEASFAGSVQRDSVNDYYINPKKKRNT